jgi:MarR family transcriptional regulator, organic hydroperoxide resistance regulator
MSFSFKKPEDSPGFLLWRITNEWQQEQRKALAKLKLTHAQFVVLATLLWLSSTNNDLVTQQQIAELSQMDKMSVSDLINTLVSKTFVKKVAHASDKRAVSIELTAIGKRLVLKAVPIVENIDKEFFTKERPNLVHLVNNLKHLIRS